MTTTTDLHAARARVQQRQSELEQARSALLVAEHAAYRDALTDASKQLGDLPAAPTTVQVEQLLSKLDATLDELGFRS